MSEKNAPYWGTVTAPLGGFITPPPFPPVYGMFNLTSYLQGASDYEIMCALLQIVKGLYDTVANLQNISNQYTDDQIGKLKEFLDKQLAQILSDFNTFKGDVNLTLNNFQSQINGFKTYADERDEYYRALEQLDIAEIKELLEKLKKEFSSKDALFNAFKQEVTTTKQYFDDFWTYSRDGCASAWLVEMSDRTAQYLDAQAWTAAQYDFCSGSRIMYNNYRVFNPVTGKFDDVQFALDSLSNFHREKSLSAETYDNLMLTAQAFSELGFTGYEWDYNGYTPESEES